jgi:hypothetical protein
MQNAKSHDEIYTKSQGNRPEYNISYVCERLKLHLNRATEAKPEYNIRLFISKLNKKTID